MDVQAPFRRLWSLSACVFLCAPSIAQSLEQGLASWYGVPFDGQRAASGEIYHKEELTAAHRTLPFGTTVRIRRTDTGASVVVRINDRGPYVESRIVDLSNAAARQLRMVEHGVVPVALEVVQAAPAEPPGSWTVQAGTFRVLANAERTRGVMEKQFGSAKIVPLAKGLWKVLVGAGATRSDAEALAAAIRSTRGLESALPVRVDAPAVPVTE